MTLESEKVAKPAARGQSDLRGCRSESMRRTVHCAKSKSHFFCNLGPGPSLATQCDDSLSVYPPTRAPDTFAWGARAIAMPERTSSTS